MSTKSNTTQEELRLDSQVVDNYTPEVETSIWYN